MPEKTVFNVGDGEVVSFGQLVKAARTALPNLRVEPADAVAPPGVRQPMDLSASKRYLGWAPEYSLERGFADYARELRAMMS